MAYRLALPVEMSRIHNVFHVSVLRKYVFDATHVLPAQPVELSEDLSYEEKPVQILDEKEQVLRNKVIPLVSPMEKSRDRGSNMGAEGANDETVSIFVCLEVDCLLISGMKSL